jgi:hypothetical protein
MVGKSPKEKKELLDLAEVRRIDIGMYKYISKSKANLQEKAKEGNFGLLES